MRVEVIFVVRFREDIRADVATFHDKIAELDAIALCLLHPLAYLGNSSHHGHRHTHLSGADFQYRLKRGQKEKLTLGVGHAELLAEPNQYSASVNLHATEKTFLDAKATLMRQPGRASVWAHPYSGTPVRFDDLTVATSEQWRDKMSGERKEKTEWHRVVIFNDNLAKIAEQYLRKGSTVYLEGSLQTRKWTDQQGVETYSTEVVLQKFRGELTLLGGRGDGGGASSSSGGGYNDYEDSFGGGGGSPEPARTPQRAPAFRLYSGAVVPHTPSNRRYSAARTHSRAGLRTVRRAFARLRCAWSWA